ncbi:hypothetical protein PoB_004954000 [Plakobranchus ocellatus]|uniref:RNase H type-1 domain-containing protein n=1 Tax=Plakobranchus ocellatus TaxID=259542 RepID=A0AAV4BR06_9GAST|nr:hypothetical protein PoB_004954000 [Plakobranchus ocellatus]
MSQGPTVPPPPLPRYENFVLRNYCEEKRRAASYECEPLAVTESLRVVIRKQRESKELRYQARSSLLTAEALEGYGSESVQVAVLLSDYLQNTEGVRVVVQLFPSHVGILGNDIAHGLANEELKTQPQPRNPLTLSDVRSVLRCGTSKLWSAAQLSDDERLFQAK